MSALPSHEAPALLNTRAGSGFTGVRLRTYAAPAAPRTAGYPRTAVRSIENLVLLLFWLLVFEGAIRKWLAPALSQYLFFIRDPVVLVLYIKAYRERRFSDTGGLLWAGLAIAAVAVPLAFLQSIGFSDNRLLPVLVYGWRQYFLYLPLPFVMASALDQQSVLRFAKHAFCAVIISAPLVMLQAASPPGAILNRGTSEEASLQFQSFAFTGGRVRPSGFFTSTVGVKELVTSSFALLLGIWLTPKAKRGLSTVLLLAASAAIATCLALSGSRAAFLHVVIVMLSTLLLGSLSRGASTRLKSLGIPVAIGVLGVTLYPLVFPTAFHAMADRFAEAYAVESKYSSLGFVARGFSDYLDFIGYLPRTPLLGYGLGLGGNGRQFLANSSALSLNDIYAESDWSRHIIDLGSLLGVIFILYRIIYTLRLFLRTVQVARAAANTLAAPLFGYAGYLLLAGQLTGHGLVNGFGWLFVGLCLVATRAEARNE